jgi:hypothetical protein
MEYQRLYRLRASEGKANAASAVAIVVDDPRARVAALLKDRTGYGQVWFAVGRPQLSGATEDEVITVRRDGNELGGVAGVDFEELADAGIGDHDVLALCVNSDVTCWPIVTSPASTGSVSLREC